MKKIFMCGHTGSNNHGCEAIVWSTSKLFSDSGIDIIYLCSFAPSQDEEFGLNNITTLISYNANSNNKIKKIISGIYSRILHNYEKAHTYIQNPLWSKLDSNSICLNIGGDTYCYSKPYSSYALTLHNVHNGIPTVLWACSIDKNKVDDEMLTDLKRYQLIIPRESITYNTLLDLGISKEQMFLSCDPAFQLEAEKTDLPNNFKIGKTIGINLSPLVIKKNIADDIVFKNVEVLIKKILKTTNYSVCLIPHVYDYKKENEDIEILKKIKNLYKDEKRIFLINEKLNAKQLKYIISKCRFFIGARTHATIAAYSTNVPTLALGYSVKSRGIANDIFGTYDGYVVSYDEIIDAEHLTRCFANIVAKEKDIIDIYSKIMPTYKSRVNDAVRFILKSMDEKNGKK